MSWLGWLVPHVHPFEPRPDHMWMQGLEWAFKGPDLYAKKNAVK